MLPARAGVVPCATSGTARPRCAPRACGGGPPMPSHPRVIFPCSPRVRGWSPGRWRRDPHLRVLPARAGIVPRPVMVGAPPNEVKRPWQWSPRERGEVQHTAEGRPRPLCRVFTEARRKLRASITSCGSHNQVHCSQLVTVSLNYAGAGSGTGHGFVKRAGRRACRHWTAGKWSSRYSFSRGGPSTYQPPRRTEPTGGGAGNPSPASGTEQRVTEECPVSGLCWIERRQLGHRRGHGQLHVGGW